MPCLSPCDFGWYLWQGFPLEQKEQKGVAVVCVREREGGGGGFPFVSGKPDAHVD